MKIAWRRCSIIKIKYQVKNTEGIHARPAVFLVKEFSKYKCNILIKKGEKEANAKEIFVLMSLCIKQGDLITITFEGEDEISASLAAEKILKNYHVNL